MKFENNTKWNTKQLRRIIAAVMNRYLGTEQRKGLHIVANPVRAGGRFRVPPHRHDNGWARNLPGRTCCLELTIPNDTTPGDIRFNCVPFARRNATQRIDEPNNKYRAWCERVSEMTLEVAPLKEKKKKDPLEEAKAALKSSEKSSEEWKDKLLRAANKVQEYDKKTKYYIARIILLKKQRSGEIRKKKTPKAGDRDFRIARRKRGA